MSTLDELLTRCAVGRTALSEREALERLGLTVPAGVVDRERLQRRRAPS